jgi:DNA topoisomerase VI subunit A
MFEGVRTHRARSGIVALAGTVVIPTMVALATDRGMSATVATLLVTSAVIAVVILVLWALSTRDLYYRQKSNVASLRSQVESLKSEIEFTKHSMREQYKLDQSDAGDEQSPRGGSVVRSGN